MKILHLIDCLDRGGAEVLLMSYLPMLHEHKHFVVTFRGPNVYDQSGYQYIQLDIDPRRRPIRTKNILRQIIDKEKIDIVHTHSFWTNIISRWATPKKIKLFNHYHFADYDTMRNKMGVKRMILMDKWIRHRSLTRVAVSEYVGQILINTFPKSTVEIIPNFIECKPNNSSNARVNNYFKIVAVGNCSLEKNYSLMLQAFEALKDQPITLDIIGGGGRLNYYIEEVKRIGLDKVRFLGHVDNAHARLSSYDLFISASNSETFGIAVLEAVCARLPLLLSDIPAFREVAPPCANFFKKNDKSDLINKIQSALVKRNDIDEVEYSNVLQKYSSKPFLESLRRLYAE